MKEIIYLDTGVLHSFMAQHNDGLPTIVNNESEETISDGAEKTKGYTSQSSIEATLESGNFEIPLIFQMPKGAIKGIFKPGEHATDKSIMSQTESGKEIISKQLHDNALEKFETYLSNSNQLFGLDAENLEGKYVKCKSTFRIIDFKYLKQIIQTEKLMKFMFIEEDEKLLLAKEEFKVNSKRMEPKQRNTTKAQLNSLSNQLDQGKKLMSSQLTFAEVALDYLSDIVPNDAFITVGDTIAPLKNEYLREKANELMFKYNGTGAEVQITMIGKVTSTIDSIETPSFEGNDVFLQLPKMLNSVLHPFGLIDVGDIIVSPVAIYFE